MVEKASNHSGHMDGLAAGSQSPVPIPEHDLIRCIGRGSYGEVWLGRNSMGVYRAVKIVFRDAFDDEKPFGREWSGIRKFEPISRSHEGFIDVLQVGINEERGLFYYIMELGDDQVSGQQFDPANYVPKSLASEIKRRGRISLEECLRLGMALSHALAELHKQELVHRDIKPSNIIFVNGVPKLADIGLVAATDEARSYVGTEGFIAPEGPGGPQADIYSLGKVLYEASTGKDRRDFPEMPTDWSQLPEYRGLLELNEVMLQACKPNPKERYASAWDMHADLALVLNGKSLKRLRQLERRWANLKKGVVTGAVALAVGGLLFYPVYREWLDRAEARQRRVTANVGYGNRAMDSGDLLGALPYYAEALRLDQGKPERERTHRLRLGSTLAQCPKLTQMWFAEKQVQDGEFSPDGRNVLLTEYYGKAAVYEIATGRLVSPPFEQRAGLRSAVYSPDGRFILTATESATATLWDATSFSEVLKLPHSNKVLSARFSPEGLRIVTACKDGVARVWDIRTGHLELELPPHADAVLFADFSHNGKLIATASRDGTARIWRASDGQPVTRPLPHPIWVNCAAFSPDDQTLVTTSDEHNARIWDVATGRRLRPDLAHDDAVESVEFSSDGRMIVTASFDGTVRLWWADSLKPLAPYPVLRHGDRVTHAAFSPDGRLIVTTCIDGSVRLWDLAGAETPPPGKHGSLCRDGSRLLTVSSNGCQLYSAGDGRAVSPVLHATSSIEKALPSADGRFVLTVCLLETNENRCHRELTVWSAETGQPIGPGLSLSNSLNSAAVSDDGQRVVLCVSNTARVWDSRNATPVSPPFLHERSVTSAQFNPAGDLVATIMDTNVQVWAVADGRPVFPALKHSVPVAYVEFSKEGRYLVTCCAEPGLIRCSAHVWSTRTGQPVCHPLHHADGVLTACFSRDESRVATASEDFTARVWDISTGRAVGLPLRHANHVRAVSFSLDGQWLATASADHTARVWDPDNTDPLTPPLQHLMAVTEIKFLADGRHLVTEDREGNTFVWPLTIEDRPAADLGQLAEFLSGVSISEKPEVQSTEPLKVTWQRLRAKYPQAFSTFPAEVLRWHEFQIEQSEAEGHWPGAVFHLERLMKLGAKDPSLSRRLAEAKAHLNKD